MKQISCKLSLLLCLCLFSCAHTADTEKRKYSYPAIKIIVSSADSLVLKMPTKSWSFRLPAQDFRYFTLYDDAGNKYARIEAAINSEWAISIKYGIHERLNSIDRLKGRLQTTTREYFELADGSFIRQPSYFINNFKGDIYTTKKYAA